MSRPVPLMFVSSPPMYTRTTAEDEESTAIFVVEEEPVEEVPEEVKSTIEKKEIDPSILKSVERLESPIGQRVYRNLTFVLPDEVVNGNVQKLEEETLFVEVDGDPEQLVKIDLYELQNIIWRGKKLPEN